MYTCRRTNDGKGQNRLGAGHARRLSRGPWPTSSAPGILAKNGEMRWGAPVYVLTEFSRQLEHDHPALHEQIMNAAGDPAELQKLFEANEESLEAISAMKSTMRQ
jgi:hypothetical protein